MINRLKIIGFLILLLFFSGCKKDENPVDDGSWQHVYYLGPGNIIVQTITPTKVKISWPSSYYAPVIVEKSIFKDTLYSLIQPNVSSNYFYDTTLVIGQKYYYRFRGVFSNHDTSSYSYLTISYDSSSRLTQSISTSKFSISMTNSDDGTLISIVNPDWGGFDIRRYSDLSLVVTKNRGNLIGNVGSETRFSADANKILTWNDRWATSITLSPYSEVGITFPDSVILSDMCYFNNDTKILALAVTYPSYQPRVYVFDIQRKLIEQEIDSLENRFLSLNSSISSDRSKVLIMSSGGFYLFDISPTLNINYFNLSTSYSCIHFLQDSNSAICVAYNGFAYLNIQSGKIIKTLSTNLYDPKDGKVYPDESKIIILGSYDRYVSIYNLNTGNLEQRIGSTNPNAYVINVVCGKNDQSFIVLYSDGTISKYSTVEFTKQWQKEN